MAAGLVCVIAGTAFWITEIDPARYPMLEKARNLSPADGDHSVHVRCNQPREHPAMRRSTETGARMLRHHVRDTDLPGDPLAHHVGVDALRHDQVGPECRRTPSACRRRMRSVRCRIRTQRGGDAEPQELVEERPLRDERQQRSDRIQPRARRESESDHCRSAPPPTSARPDEQNLRSALRGGI